MKNVNPETGIRYGIIHANSLDSEVVNVIQMYGKDVHWEDAVRDAKEHVNRLVEEGEIPEEEFDSELDDTIESMSNQWYDDEPVHEFEMDGVKGRTTWLGGALHIWVFESPVISKARLCSPCVPNCGDLDSLSESGEECYDVPKDWRVE